MFPAECYKQFQQCYNFQVLRTHIIFKHLYGIFAAFFLVCLLTGDLARAQEDSTDTTPIAPEYLINYGDEIEVDILGSSEFDWRGTPDSEGFLSQIPLVEKPIFALCQTEKAVAAQLAKEFSANLRDPQVVVHILDRSKRPTAMVVGAVFKPQKYRIYRPVRLNELLILSGGITSEASGEIRILRQGGLGCQNTEKTSQEKKETMSGKNQPSDLIGASFSSPAVAAVETSFGLLIKLADLVGGKTESNPFIYSGDVVTVLEAQPIYVTGGVVAPQRIFYRNELTLTRALAIAGGFSPNSTEDNITVYRRENGVSKIIAVDFERIRRKTDQDFVLKPFDIIEVPQNGRVKSLRQPIVVNSQNQAAKLVDLNVRTIN